MEKLNEFVAKRRLKEFKVDNKYFRDINEGVHGKIYQLTDEHVGKFSSHPTLPITINLKYLQEENEICKIAYENEISVPKPEGVFKVRFLENNEFHPSFVMEYVEGQTLSEIRTNSKNSCLCEKILDLTKKEINKAKEIDLIPSDWDNEGNIIWNFEKEKIYLIDFGAWRFK